MEFGNSAWIVLIAAMLVLALAGYYSRYFLRSIVKPVEEISTGLKEIEEGNLDIHIAASGQVEIRNMIHQFNAMARRLKALIGEYEEKMRGKGQSPEEYLAAMIRKEIQPREADSQFGEYFLESYVIIGLCVEKGSQTENEGDTVSELVGSFERNPRYASRCTAYIDEPAVCLIFYRITEEEYRDSLINMLKELQKSAAREFGAEICACISRKCFGAASFDRCIADVREKLCLHHLYGSRAIVDLGVLGERADEILELSGKYERLANALYTADEKNVAEEKEKLFAGLTDQEVEKGRVSVLAAILAIGNLFTRDNGSFVDVFGQKYNYMQKVKRIGDSRSLKLWLTNYFAWIMDYSASKLKVAETDVMIRAKRYIGDHYEEPDLSLTRVAEYVELNEKYFTNRFTRETGENFTTYLTGLRMQKAKELLKTTTFKVYEIAEMVGYNNVEHFNRVFKKMNHITPAQYRKTM